MLPCDLCLYKTKHPGCSGLSCRGGTPGRFSRFSAAQNCRCRYDFGEQAISTLKQEPLCLNVTKVQIYMDIVVKRVPSTHPRSPSRVGSKQLRRILRLVLSTARYFTTGVLRRKELPVKISPCRVLNVDCALALPLEFAYSSGACQNHVGL